MEVTEDTVQNIQKFAQGRQNVEKESTREPLTATTLHAYTRRLDGTLRVLQEQVQRQEEELKKVCCAKHGCHSHQLIVPLASRDSIRWS